MYINIFINPINIVRLKCAGSPVYYVKQNDLGNEITISAKMETHDVFSFSLIASCKDTGREISYQGFRITASGPVGAFQKAIDEYNRVFADHIGFVMKAPIKMEGQDDAQ